LIDGGDDRERVKLKKKGKTVVTAKEKHNIKRCKPNGEKTF